MNKKLLVILPVAGLLLLVGTASAMGFGWFGAGKADIDTMAAHMQTMFQAEANILGIPLDEVKAGWAAGKNINQIAQEHGITQDQLRQKMKDAKNSQMKTMLEAMVDKGVLTQAQADSRLQWLQNNPNGHGHGWGRMMGMRGMMKDFGWMGF